MEPGAPPPPSSPSSGSTLFGKYQLVRLLGRGTFGKVFQARSLIDGSAVAIKIFDKAKTVDASMEPRIVREIESMRRLQNHPNILKIHEVMASKKKIYIVMELAKGGELFAKIAGGRRLREGVARRYFQQLVSALNFCHRNGITHRDIKPQNLLLDEFGNLKVCDFGLSALPEHVNDGLLHTFCGTPAYTAPEVIRQRAYDGSKADAWSCGVILFVLLAGQLPFDDSNIPMMGQKMHRREYKVPEFVPKPARFVVHRLLDPNPESRMSIEQLMQNAWFKKSLRPEPENSLFESESMKEKNCKPEAFSMANAFDIISLSSGLNLSGLFETTAYKKEKRFTARDLVSAEAVLERVKEIGERLGFRTEKGKGGWSLGLGKGKVVVIVNMVEMAPSLFLGEVKIVEGGVEFEELHWVNLKNGLEQELVLSWHN